ncbi:MAG: DUF167 family protein [Kiloniellales bacterium]|nr:DUF167 family protein [Kiloniellales bacterium]
MGSTAGTPFRPLAEGVRVAVHLQPGARREALGGPVELADGAVLIKAWVTAPPEGGKANARLLALLAKAWKLPKSDLEVASGAKERRKSILVRGDPALVLSRLHSWLASRNGS